MEQSAPARWVERRHSYRSWGTTGQASWWTTRSRAPAGSSPSTTSASSGREPLTSGSGGPSASSSSSSSSKCLSDQTRWLGTGCTWRDLSRSRAVTSSESITHTTLLLTDVDQIWEAQLYLMRNLAMQGYLRRNSTRRTTLSCSTTICAWTFR